MDNLRFTQRLLHYFDFLVSEYGFVYAADADLDSSFVDGGCFQGTHFDLVVRLGRREPVAGEGHALQRHPLQVFLRRRDGASVMDAHALVDALALNLEPCPVVGEIRTRPKLDLALAYYARLIRAHFGGYLSGDVAPPEMRKSA